jgi:3-oxoacyl-[acyl-carrier protein] reductase
MAVQRHNASLAQNQPCQHPSFAMDELAVNERIQSLHRHVRQANVLQATCFLCCRCTHSFPFARKIFPFAGTQDHLDIYTRFMDTGLRNRVAIIAASSQGMGRSTALAFAAEGAHLVLCARNADALEQVAEEARRAHGIEVYTEPFDVSDDDRVRRFVASVQQRFGRVDVCVTNAGGPPAKPFAETTMPEWDRAYQLNLRSIVSFAQAALPAMQQRHWGRFITITSISVRQPVPELVLSNSIRTGVLGLVRSLATQYGPDNITVNNVAPGYTATDRIKELTEMKARKSGRTVAEYEEDMVKDIPLHRLAQPEEIANAIVWLASERAAYVTGQTLLVDGGVYRGL